MIKYLLPLLPAVLITTVLIMVLPVSVASDRPLLAWLNSVIELTPFLLGGAVYYLVHKLMRQR